MVSFPKSEKTVHYKQGDGTINTKSKSFIETANFKKFELAMYYIYGIEGSYGCTPVYIDCINWNLQCSMDRFNLFGGHLHSVQLMCRSIASLEI